MKLNTKSNRQWILLMIAWLTALVSTLGAVFLSKVIGLEPCELCWYQRIAMFPLVAILGIGAYTQDPRCINYAQSLALPGWAIALYHCLLYGGFIPERLQPCGKGGSCAEQKLELIGFITVPLLSFFAFSLLVLLLAASKKIGSSHEQ
jgi:disulfide bond formation protein DsbB